MVRPHLWIGWIPLLLLSGTISDTPQAPETRLSSNGYTIHGDWSTEVSVSPTAWQPGAPVAVSATLVVTEDYLAKLAAANIKVDGFVLLATAERTFDANGRLRQAGDERMSTLITPTGLPIEGGVTGAATNRFGYGFRTPVDLLATQSLAQSQTMGDSRRQVKFTLQTQLPSDLPPGVYRLRLDYGVTAAKRNYSMNGEGFALRPFFKGRPTESHVYTPPIRASGKDISGMVVDATHIRPRVPWVLLNGYNSNGYRGVVADEDKANFAISGRNLIQDDVILPLYDNNGKRVSYNLEPQFPTDTIEVRSNIPWNFAKGELSIQVEGPDGLTIDLGTAPFVGQSGQWPTTKRSAFTAWRPPAYGQYTVKAMGWIEDEWGNRYDGGGTYHFWIAKRMTLATATFQGMAYPVGGRYGRDLGFSPAVPADVDITATLFVNSDPKDTRIVTSKGKATPSGIFGAVQGMKQLPLDAPGEYLGHVLAKYVDRDGHLWVCSMRHAGVVYPPDTPVVARGKKVKIKGNYVDRGDTNFEGWVDTAAGISYLAHINYPWNPGDVLLIASEGQGANKIEPVLTFEPKDNPPAYDAKLQGLGVTNLRLRTSNGYSPHMFPEYIVDWCYYYGAAPRPGFMARFIVGEDGVRAPYWPTSPNSFGSQINASSNGDLPGDIYRLIGGVVVRKQGQSPLYAGYIASAFLLPKGSGNNRVVAPGAEDLIGPTGETARAFLVGLRPGMVYETGHSFAPAMQIDPILPVNITFALEYPDGRSAIATGTGDTFGSFVGKDRWTLDVPGIYKYTIEGVWNGHRAIMPGLPATGGEFYVVEKERPADAPQLTVNLPNQTSFLPSGTINISGTTTASVVHWAAVVPGAVIGQGVLPTIGGIFDLTFDPKTVNQETPTYDIVNRTTGNPEVKDVVHLTFFSKETARDGTTYHSFQRVILRGNQVITVK